jgi:hypothetical protein
MEVNQIKFQDGLPSEVSVTMSIEEAVAIAKVFGMMNGHAHDKLGLPRSDDGPYGALVDVVFHRYWENGLGDFRHLSTVTLESLNTMP